MVPVSFLKRNLFLICRGAADAPNRFACIAHSAAQYYWAFELWDAVRSVRFKETSRDECGQPGRWAALKKSRTPQPEPTVPDDVFALFALEQRD
jgi:hypothetical protein